MTLVQRFTKCFLTFLLPFQNPRGRVLPSVLDLLVRVALEKGENPFFVCSAAGTTVFGAFDPITEVVDTCQK